MMTTFKKVSSYKTRQNYLNEACDTVCKDRNEQYGEPEDNFQMIADFWTTYLKIPITAEDVAVMMVLFKVARAKQGKSEDNFVDMIGYAACGGEIYSKRTAEDNEALEKLEKALNEAKKDNWINYIKKDFIDEDTDEDTCKSQEVPLKNEDMYNDYIVEDTYNDYRVLTCKKGDLIKENDDVYIKKPVLMYMDNKNEENTDS